MTVKSGTISSTQSDAIVADGGGVKVDNSGTVSGTVKLVGSTSAAFNILKGGVYESGATAVLAANDTLTNAPFAVTSKIDRTVTDLGTAVEIIGGNDTALGLQYDGQLGETTTQHTWSGKLGVKF